MQNKNEDTTKCNAMVQNTTNSESTPNTATFQFQGNKNGIGTKLGAMAVDLCPQETSVIQQPQLEVAEWSVTANTGHLSGKHARQIPDSVYAARYQSMDHKNCLYQNDKKFGFVPVNDLMVYTGQEMVWGHVLDIVEAHARVKQSGLLNFMKLRIPVEAQLKVKSWKKYLDSYWDRQLVDLIQFGFPLDFDRNVVLNSTEVNHNSALKYPEQISKYITEELKYGAILGPFPKLPRLLIVMYPLSH